MAIILKMSIVAPVIYTLCVGISLICGLLAAISDLRGMRIPNSLSLIILVTFVPPALLSWYDTSFGTAMPGALEMHILSFAGVFVTTLILFGFGILGAGDSKLMSAYGLWLGPSGIIPFIFSMALAGFILALIGLIIRRFHLFSSAPVSSWIGQLHIGPGHVPYGVAIFAGAICGYAASGYFNIPLLS